LLPGLLPQPARTTKATSARILFIVFPAGWMLVSWVRLFVCQRVPSEMRFILLI
jgi:hypothetical protein